MHNDSLLLHARWVFPVIEPPLRDGVVEILAGRIVNVRSFRSGDRVHDLGSVALIPGLVNAHTHLEFSSLTQPLGTSRMPFPDWIAEVIRYRRSRSTNPEQEWKARDEAILQGLRESHATGVVAVGEIIPPPSHDSLYDAHPPAATLFLELLGLAPDQIDRLWQIAVQQIDRAIESTGRTRLGISPHAPYTVAPELLKRVCQLSHEKQFPVAMHLAETVEELELLSSGSGPLASFLASLRAWSPGWLPRGMSPQDYLDLLAEADRSLIVHGNCLSSDEIEFLGQRSERMSVVYCPRTHAAFNAGAWRLAEMLAANVNVCLGTDSRASNPDLSLWHEMQFVARQHPLVSPEGVLYLGTLAGAEALGRSAEFGSIAEGKSARLAIVDLPLTTANDPHELLFGDGTRCRPLTSPRE